jgi:RNA polymerase subunit RPABC4/transcription elongation factor Spt4
MNCSKCNAQIAFTEIYCPSCGAVNDPANKTSGKPVETQVSATPQPGAQMVLCKHCKKIFAEGAEFCNSCGREQSGLVRCLHCTGLVPQNAKYCDSCGKEQSMAGKPKPPASSAGNGIGGRIALWTCGSCLLVVLIIGFALVDYINSFRLWKP